MSPKQEEEKIVLKKSTPKNKKVSKKVPQVDDQKKNSDDEYILEDNEYHETKLSVKQELFCQTFTTKNELFGNGVQTYIEVYKPKQDKKNRYKQACVVASQILSNVKVYKRINELLDANGLNDVEVDKQHKYLIEQHEDKGVKMRAIDSYNKLKKRMEDKIVVNNNIEVKDTRALDKASLDELKDIISAHIKGN